MGPSVSTVICAYSDERREWLARAVESVRSQARACDEVIVVVDHNPTLLRDARRRWEHVVENAHEPGLSGARNSGVAAARGDVIAFLDDDAEATPGWLDGLRVRYGEPAVIGVGGAVVPMWPRARPTWFPEEFHWVVGCTFRDMLDGGAPVRNVFGANMSFRREVFRGIGGFRDGFGRVGTLPEGCEETELCIRAGRRWPDRVVVMEPRARVLHHVAPGRATWRYFLVRCHAEGISKARLTQLVGGRAGLASERTYAARTLPAGALRGLADGFLRGDATGFRRTAAIVLGLATTTAGYVRGQIGDPSRHGRRAAPTWIRT